MQIDNEVFENCLPKGVSWDEQAFVFCEFRNIVGEGTHISSIFVDCGFDQCDMYWGMFNIATFVGVSFRHCVFRGCLFPDCRFVECRFEACLFTVDSFGAGCDFRDSRWYGCTQDGTHGLSTALVPFASGDGKRARG
ncbi:hypothetical protein RKE25_20575 [Dyella sp. BiH032]|uniref:pentapeptide repeat-containing protein n=1 Tax=Dyella sp. BiH032 TaxID=3075430 RepID=UPI00289371C4|nr:pentapeptide repeat-containing protein [Dyella sp. BiH032]WNL45777.1 hypothetical protein RKE25_20575 [Dyella sp. BiH032]